MSDAIRRVLIVDDDAVVRMLASALLQRSGYDVATDENGADALRTIESADAFDVIVTDLDMPNVDGRTLLATLRARAATASPAVIILTGSDDPETHAALFQAGAVACITKPINPATFVDQLRAALRAAE